MSHLNINVCRLYIAVLLFFSSLSVSLTHKCTHSLNYLPIFQAYKANVICPNKHQSDPEKFYNNQLLESETYIGGHVECLESGVFRSDLPTSFKLDPSGYQVWLSFFSRISSPVWYSVLSISLNFVIFCLRNTAFIVFWLLLLIYCCCIDILICSNAILYHFSIDSYYYVQN